MKAHIFAGMILVLLPIEGHGQDSITDKQNEIFWKISHEGGISWNIKAEDRLPHSDNIEMSGEKVAAIISYDVDENKLIHIERDIIFPQLRVFIKSNEPDWRKYRAYLREIYDDLLLPSIVIDRRTFAAGPLDSVRINGQLELYHAEHYGVLVKRTLLPSMTNRLFVEHWEIKNTTDSVRTLDIRSTDLKQEQIGIYGLYKRKITCDAQTNMRLRPGATTEFGIYFSAYLDDEPGINESFADVILQRRDFLNEIKGQLILESPDAVLNTLFYFSKIRAAESIYKTKMGLVHSPGGGRYYTGVWANDQAEYSGPFFPYLGYEKGNVASINAYRMFQRNTPKNNGHFWSSFEMNGEIPCCGSDRGDAAMIAFGASQFALASGKEEVGVELWPLIKWSLEYCERHKNDEGVIESETDEMEGRIPTGSANLSTSSLYYGALLQAAYLLKALGHDSAISKRYQYSAIELRQNIESYFGAEIEGLKTYKYFKEHEYLRHWICLPLVMGIEDRKDDTLEALFSKLWSDNGVRVEYNPGLEEPDLFWDRGTLYAFRGAFKSGAADRALTKLQSYSKTRLLGFHVPYVVEAWPEGNMAHLSAESALYCRIYTEGLLGIVPTGFNSFTMRPYLPTEWNELSLRRVMAFDSQFDISIRRINHYLNILVSKNGRKVMENKVLEGDSLEVIL